MKIRINYLLLWCVGLILCLFSVTSSLLSYIIPSNNVQIALVVILFCVCFIYFFAGSSFHRSDFVFILIALFMALFSVIRSAWSMQSQVIFVSCILFSLLCGRHKHIDDILNAVVWIILAAMVFYAACTIFLQFNRSIYMNYVINLFPEERTRLITWYNTNCMAGLTSHYSTNGMFLATGLCISGAWFSVKRSKISLAFVILFIITLLMTGKRAQPIFGAAAIFVLYVLSLSKEKAGKRILKIVGIVIVCACVFVVLLSALPTLGTFIERFQERAADGDVSNGRFRMWALAFNAFKENPIFGIGWKQFAPTISPAISSVKTYDVHNTYIQILCETGIVGFAVFMTWFIKFYSNTVKEYKVAVDLGVNCERRRKFMLAFSVAYQTFFFIYFLTGNPLYERIMYIPYFVCCGITMYYRHFGISLPDAKQQS